MKNSENKDLQAGYGAPPTGGTVQIGTVVAYMGTTPPDTWLLCDGNKIPDQYNTLIGMIGSNTPNFSGRTLIGAGSGLDANSEMKTFSLGQFGGEYSQTLTIAQIPSHSHAITYSFWGSSQGGGSGDATNLRNSSESKETGLTGGGTSHNNVQPYYTVNYIIYAGTN